MLQVVPENVDIIINAHKATIVAEHVLLRSLTVLYLRVCVCCSVCCSVCCTEHVLLRSLTVLYLRLMRNQCMYLHVYNARVSVCVCVKIRVCACVFMCMYMMHAYDMAH